MIHVAKQPQVAHASSKWDHGSLYKPYATEPTLFCRLIPLTTVITPNLPEAAALLDCSQISDVEGMKEAAARLHAFGPEYVLVKGGHLEGDAR